MRISHTVVTFTSLIPNPLPTFQCCTTIKLLYYSHFNVTDSCNYCQTTNKIVYNTSYVIFSFFSPFGLLWNYIASLLYTLLTLYAYLCLFVLCIKNFIEKKKCQKYTILLCMYISVIHVKILDCVYIYIHVGVVTINKLCYTIILKPANTNILLNTIVLPFP